MCKFLCVMKLWCAKLGLYMKYGVRATKDMWSIAFYKIMISKHENLCVVCWNDILVPGWKLSGWLNDMECMVEREMEDLVMVFICRHLYSLIRVLWCCEILHLILTFQGPLLEVGDLKVMIKFFVFWRSFLRVLVVSWGPCTTSSQSSSSFPLRLLKVPISFCSSMWLSRISVSSISENPFSRTLPVNPRKFVILSRYLGNSWKSLSASSQHFFQ